MSHAEQSEPRRSLEETVPDLRVARVLRAREHPNADRLLLLDVDLESEERQLVAGIAGRYTLEDLEGLDIVVVSNLDPARLRGELSRGMLLAGEHDDALGLLLATGAPPGTPLRAHELPEPAERIDIGEFSRHEIVAHEDGVTLNGRPLDGAELTVDRGVLGRLR